MWIVFAVIGGPIAFFLLVWIAVTCIRLWRPEEPIPLQKDKHMNRRLRIRAGEQMPLRFEDIRDIERERRAVFPGDQYSAEQEETVGTQWVADLDLRRN